MNELFLKPEPEFNTSNNKEYKVKVIRDLMSTPKK